MIDDRIYNQKDFDRTMVIDERTELVARTITDYLKRTNPMDKTIVFCNDIMQNVCAAPWLISTRSR